MEEKAKKKKVTESSLRKSLYKQLEDKGALVDHYVDLVEDYLKLRRLKRKLETDISKRGATYQERNSAHEMVWKNNPATKDLTAVSRQMLQILREMDLTTKNVGGFDDGEL